MKSKKKVVTNMKYEATTTSAINFAKENKIEEWVHLFLCGEGNNQVFSDGLKLEPRRYFIPEKMKLSLFERCCGPEPEMEFHTPENEFIKRVDCIAAKFNEGEWDMPPLIIYRDRDGYRLSDGNHRYEALKKSGVDEYWVIVWE